MGGTDRGTDGRTEGRTDGRTGRTGVTLNAHSAILRIGGAGHESGT